MYSPAALALASILRSSNAARPVLLLGAGASFSSGVPAAAESVRRIAKGYYADRVQGGALLPEQVKLSEWQAWLHAQPWFVRGEDRLADNFPLVVEHLLKPREYRSRILRELFRPTGEFGKGYGHLADLVMKGLLNTVLTTNFDECLEGALRSRYPHIPHIARVNRGERDLREFSLYNRAQIVWLHGCAEQYTDRNSNGEIERLDDDLVQRLSTMLADCPLIVIGYRGSEPSVMEHLLGTSVDPTLKFKNGIYWCRRGGEPLHPHVEALGRRIGDNLNILDIAGFDELMSELALVLASDDLYPRAAQRAHHAVAFDDNPVKDASFADLDEDLMLVVMREYCSSLGRPAVTKDTLPRLLAEQGLLVNSSVGTVPTGGCMLLFGRDPQRYFPHAVVSATIGGKKRVRVSGNLITQHRELLEWLRSPEINPVVKLKRGATHTPIESFAPRALVELLMNLLVHRDYEVAESAEIDVEAGRGITFRNPGTLLEDFARQIALDSSGKFKAVAKVSALRNRALCDVFFGLRKMEREGTGLLDVETLSRDQGGQAMFEYDAKAKRFIAELRAPRASSDSAVVARDDRPTGLYVINSLPFLQLPETVSSLRLNTSLWKRPSGLSLEGFPVGAKSQPPWAAFGENNFR